MGQGPTVLQAHKLDFYWVLGYNVGEVMIMKKYVPIEKQSKRKQREYYGAQRRDWGGMSPVTQRVPNLKGYDRKKSKRRFEDEPGLDFFVGLI